MVFKLCSGLFLYTVQLLFVLALAQDHPVSLPTIQFKPTQSTTPLSDNSVYSILQDKTGYLWVGTYRGLHRFDGVSYKNYQNRSGDTDGLPANWVTTLAESDQGQLWIGTQKGLARYDSINDRIISVAITKPDSDEIPPAVTALTVNHEQLWIGTLRGLFLSVPGRPIREIILAKGIEHAWISGIAISERGLWVATYQNGLFFMPDDQIDQSDSDFVPVSLPMPDPTIYDISLGLDDRLLIATQNGVFQRPNEQQLPWVEIWVKDETSEYNSPVIRLLRSDDDLWMATIDEGIIHYQLGTGRFRRYLHNNAEQTLPSNEVRSFWMDNKGILWVGFLKRGLWHGLTDSSGFELIRTTRTQDRLNQTDIANIWSVNDQLWATDAEGQAKYIDVQSQQLLPIDWDSIGVSEELPILLTGYQDKDGMLWLGTPFGLSRLDLSNGDFQTIKLRKNPDRPWFFIFKITQTDDGALWLASERRGLWRYDPQTGQSKQIEQLSSPQIHSLYKSSDNFLLVGSSNGVDRVNPATLQVDQIIQQLEGQMLTSPSVSAIAETKPGIFWLGTENGLNRLDLSVKQPRLTDLSEDFIDQHIYQIYPDTQGCLWMSSNIGVIRYCHQNNKVNYFGSEFGVPSLGFNIHASYQTANKQTIFFGGIEGVTQFNPESVISQPSNAQVIVSGINLGENELPVYPQKKIDIAYSQQVLRIKVALLDFLSPEKNQFEYRLLGSKRQWQSNGSSNEIVFTQLDPGHYTLEVRGIDARGNTSRNELKLPIQVAPPIWRTWWAYLIYFLCLFTLISVFWIQRKKTLDIIKSRERFRNLKSKLFSSTSAAVWIMDSDRRILEVNRGFEQTTGFTADESRGRPVRLIRFHGQTGTLEKTIYETTERNGQWRGQIWSIRKNGEEYPAFLVMNLIDHDDDDVTGHYVAMMTDTLEQHQAAKKLEELAYFDSLTELPNRANLERECKNRIALLEPDRQQLGLVFIDLDHFKTINDSLGHGVGDQLLAKVSTTLTEQLPPGSFISRWGGDEFVVLVTMNSDQAEFSVLAQLIIDSLSKPFSIDGYELCVTVSVGIARTPADAKDGVSLLRFADAALYQAKRSGRNQYCLFDQNINREVELRWQLESDLRNALSKEGWQFQIQPAFNQNDEIVFAEVLARWHHPELGQVLPDRFIALAEETGLIIELEERIISSALKQAHRWHQDGLLDFHISLNLSALEFRRDDLSGWVMSCISKYPIPPNLLELEITEGAVIADPLHAQEQINELRAMGISIAIDDFGTGHSSLSQLCNLNVSRLKIDKSFIDQLHNSREAGIVVGILQIAASLGIDVVAEGVETEQQAQILDQLGCEVRQGYLYSKPLDINAFEELLKRR